MAQLGVDYADTDTINKPGVAGFQQAKAAGARIIIPRATFGRPTYGQSPVYLDSYWARDKEDILAAGLNRSAYMFICVPTSTHPAPSPEVQVAAFYGYVQLNKPKAGQKPQDMVPFFDVEMESDAITPAAYYDWILEVAKQLRSAFGAWPGMYTSDCVWNEVLKSHAAGPLINCPLWVAKPWPWAVGSPVHLDGAPGYNPTTLPEWDHQWAIYQYAGDAKGMPGFAPGATDTNRVNIIKRGATGGTVKWIQARAGGGLVVDGVFGGNTETRIKELQTQYAMTADGIVGVDTLTLLSWLNPAPL